MEPNVARRNHELTEIAKSIASLADLFKDLSALVIDQGTILDSVEYNVEQTAIHVQEAVKVLNEATRYESSHDLYILSRIVKIICVSDIRKILDVGNAFSCWS